MLRALAAARKAGFELDRELLEGLMMFLDQMYDPVSGRTGYNDVGSRPPRLAGRGEDFPAELSEMVTGIVIRTRLELGQTPMEIAAIRRGAALLGDVAPTWNRERGTIDYYSWFFGSEALERLGGYQLDYWRANLIEALAEHQRFDAEGRGWWPALDAWSGAGATVHSTVMCSLALQAVLD